MNQSTKRHSARSGVSISCASHWPPSSRVDGGYFHRTYSADFPGRSPASLAAALAGRLLFFGLSGFLSCSRYITGTLYIAIDGPFVPFIIFSYLAIHRPEHCLDSGRRKPMNLLKNIERHSLLALRAVVCAPAGNKNPSDRRPAPAAGQTRPQIHAVHQLKKAAHPVGVNVIGHR